MKKLTPNQALMIPIICIIMLAMLFIGFNAGKSTTQKTYWLSVEYTGDNSAMIYIVDVLGEEVVLLDMIDVLPDSAYTVFETNIGSESLIDLTYDYWDLKCKLKIN